MPNCFNQVLVDEEDKLESSDLQDRIVAKTSLCSPMNLDEEKRIATNKNASQAELILCQVQMPYWFPFHKHTPTSFIGDEELPAVPEFDDSLSPGYFPSWAF